MNRKNLAANPFFVFLPFLALYVIFIFIFANPDFSGDENRYLAYAQHLTHGFYSYPRPYLDLGNGPGYPLLITPFVALNFSLISIKLLNALFYYLSVVLLFKSLQQYVSGRFALIFSIVWALYPNTFEKIQYALPEVFASSLIPLFIFCLTYVFNNQKKHKAAIIAAGLTFGYLALTKPIFGYVLLVMIGGTVVLLLINAHSHYKKILIILLIAFAITMPWLTYTYSMTGKIFYWSSYGGNNLYWMTSPYENEYGDWMTADFDTINPDLLPGSEKIIKLHHQMDFQRILDDPKAKKLYFKNGVMNASPYTGVIQDDLLKKIAYNNIKLDPIKFVENCISNIGRMIFNYPASYTLQKPSTLKRLPVNGTLLVLALFCFIMTILHWKKISFVIRFLLFFGFIYFGGSILGSADPRMFTVIVPILLYWIAYVLERTVKIKVRFNE